MKKILVLLVMLIGLGAHAQTERLPYSSRWQPVSATSIVPMSGSSYSEQFSDSLAQTTNDTIYVAFGGKTNAQLNGFVTVVFSPDSAMTLKAWGFPCTGIYSVNGITLTKNFIFDSSWGADSLAILDPTSGVSLAAGAEYSESVGQRASGDILSWGLCRGLMIIVQKTDANNELLTVEVLGQ